ncbi:MAG: 4-(cytidine 5'-diphospho)-2-C-methyl-D-erythritol kinase [Oscillospiraceae bacterium]|jgi:4-diphosphocytidyl-2-C-methyl-D-erythritol kinase|nr:4-(cytidine 5'-diphospho)-2-C-methyl-D-erythritol kinase [Oscillospiraceae bacterium]
MQITLRAHAKINLLLDVTGRRADGYHTTEMLMQSVGLCDTVTIATQAQPGVALQCDRPGIPLDQSNIACKAAAAFFSAVPQLELGLCIKIEKRIPAAAGLAGGSADGAAVLHGLRALFAPGIGDDALAAIALRVGADVPFCLRGGLCFAEGVGELLTPLPCLPVRYALVLAKPAMGVATGAAYARIDALPNPRHPAARQALACARAQDWEALFPLCGNLFEQVTPPEALEGIRKVMRSHGALLAQMSGSGPTMFGVFRTEDAANACAEALRRADGTPEVFCCRATERGIGEIR